MIGLPASLPPAPMSSRPPGERRGTTVDLGDRTTDVPGRLADVNDGFGGYAGDIVDEWGRQSFPASDPPGNW